MSNDPIRFAAPDVSEDDIRAVSEVLRSGWITTGEECHKLEQELATYLDVPHVVAMSSCTAALETTLAFANLGRDARVGVPTWTFTSSALAAHREGYQPILLDVEPDTLNLSPDAVADAMDEGLDAVVAVHLGGVPVDRRIHELCEQAGIPLVEDAAHALGARDHRGMVAGQGTAGACFSFYATKNLTSGEGGALATDNPELAEFAQSYRLHGMSRDAWARYNPDAPDGYDVVAPGIKGNMPDLLAALARSQLTRFDAMQTRRRELVTRYREGLEAIPGLRCVPAAPVAGSADHLMLVILPEGTDRPGVQALLLEEGIGTSVHFQPLHRMRWFQEHGRVARRGVSVAERAAPRALTLPLYPSLSDDQVDRVCRTLGDAL